MEVVRYEDSNYHLTFCPDSIYYITVLTQSQACCGETILYFPARGLRPKGREKAEHVAAFGFMVAACRRGFGNSPRLTSRHLGQK